MSATWRKCRCRTERLASITERRSIPRLYKRPSSLAPTDQSVVPLSSPAEIFKLYHFAHLTCYRSGPRRPGGFCCDISSVLPGLQALPDRRSQTDGVALLHPLTFIFLGKGSKCQSPRRKVGMQMTGTDEQSPWTSRRTCMHICFLCCWND